MSTLLCKIMFQEQNLATFLPIVWDEDPTNKKEERKLHDTYLGGQETLGEKGKREIKNDTSIGGNGKEKTEKMKIKNDTFT